MRIILTESRVDSARILEILTASKPANKEDPNYSYYKELADWANPGRNQAGKEISLDKSNTAIKISDRSLIDKNPTKLAKRYNNLGALLSVLKNLMDSAGYNPNNVNSKLIQKTAIEILASLSGKFPKKEQPEEKPQEEEPKSPQHNLYQGMDWTAERARRLANANGEATSAVLEKFYNDYYKIEYAGLKSPSDKDSDGIVAQLHSLDKILVKEFNKLGYNPATNPLAQFLKILIMLKKEKGSTIFDKLTTNTYGAIHNSFIDNKVTGNMLGNYSDKTKKTILFCEDLYNYKGLDIVDYLLLQSTALSSATNDDRFSNDPELIIAKLFVHQNIPEQPGKPLGYKEQIQELLKPDTKIVLPSEKGTKMRSWLEISELIHAIFNVTVKKNFSDADMENITEQAKAKNIIISMLTYLYNQNVFERERPDAAKEVKDWLDKQNIRSTDKGIKDSQQMLVKYELNSANIVKLAGKLMSTFDAANKGKQ